MCGSYVNLFCVSVQDHRSSSHLIVINPFSAATGLFGDIQANMAADDLAIQGAIVLIAHAKLRLPWKRISNSYVISFVISYRK